MAIQRLRRPFLMSQQRRKHWIATLTLAMTRSRPRKLMPETAQPLGPGRSRSTRGSAVKFVEGEAERSGLWSSPAAWISRPAAPHSIASSATGHVALWFFHSAREGRD